MSGPPYDIKRFFQHPDPIVEDSELELHEVQVVTAAPDQWILLSGGHRELDSTVLAVLFQKGVNRIAVKFHERIVEFDLMEVLLRSGKPLTAVERTLDEERHDTR